MPAAARTLVPVVGGLLVAAYLVGRTAPGISRGTHLAVREWGAVVLYLVAAASCLARGFGSPAGASRRAWLLIGAGALSYASASIISYASGRPVADPPAISLGLWLLFYPAAYASLMTLLRSRLRPFTLSFCLDGVVGALTAGALTAAIVPHDLAGLPIAKALVGLTYPCADLVLLSIVLWAAAMTGWRGAMWSWLAGGLAILMVGDVGEAVQFARGSYDPMVPTTAGFPLGLIAIGIAAWCPLPPRRALRTDTLSVLAMPMACVLAVLGTLVVHANAVSRVLSIATVAVAMVRAALSYREVGVLHESRRFQRGFREATIGMALVSADLHWLRVNDALCALLGRSADELVGRSVLDVLHPEEHEAAGKLGEFLLSGRRLTTPLDRRFLRRDGSIVDIQMTAALVDDDGTPQLFAQYHDVSGRKRAERHNAALATLSRTALELRAAGDLITTVRCAVQRALAAESVTMTPQTPTPGPHRLSSAITRRGGAVRHLVARRVESAHAFDEHDARFLEAAANVLGTALDRAAMEDELRARALHDPLTGLANRSFLAEHVERAITGIGRGEQLAVLLLDLDRFKVVNDTLGHGAGDELLCAVAARLRDAVREGDVVARLGGDEFVVACRGGDDAAWEIASLAQALLDAIAVPYPLGDRELHVTASAGLVFVDGTDATAESLLRDADVAMYRAKEHGGARYEVFDAGLRAALVHRLAIEGELRHAIARNELLLHLQPVMDLHRDELTGFEALVRWEHPERGLVPPGEFISIAEETGLIVEIGRWVLGEAARCLAVLQDHAGRSLRMSVNLSARQIRPALAGEVRAALAEANITPHDLTLEVTETLLVEDAAAVELLETLRADGIQIAIDDFGTGWSSLGALQRYPADILKLDRSLVAPAAESSSAAALARAVVEMAQALGLQVVAEGIEDEAQLTTMQILGCPYGQGYVFAKPMALDDAIALVADGGTAARAAS